MPFLVLSLARSRSFWLSRFLSYGDWHCGHDEIIHLRGLDDIKSWFRQDCTGSAETAGAPFWRTIVKACPEVRIVVVRRPVADVVDSLMKIDMHGAAALDRDKLTHGMLRMDAKLSQIERRVPNVLSVNFADLATESACAAVFEHCLPYRHDPAWWAKMNALNLQSNVAATMRYFFAHKPQLDKLTAIVRHQTLADFASKPAQPLDSIVIRREKFDASYPDATRLFQAHCVQVGEAPDSHLTKNIGLFKKLDDMGALQIMTARCNGRMFGYLVTIISPSLESPDALGALHTTFFASPEFPGLGLKLQRAANAELRARGVSDVVMRAGIRGSGQKLGAIYRRLGAENFGQMYMLKLQEA